MTDKKIRQSNFELLRIIAMFFIVMAHYAGHGIFEVSSNYPYKNYLLGDEINRYFTLLLTPGGKTGVAIFFLLTGYFCYKRKTISDLTKVISQSFVYAFILTFLSFLFKITHTFVVSNGAIISSFTNCILPFSSGAWWFVTTYICLMMVSPQINSVISNFNKKGDILLLLLLFIFWNIFGIETKYYNLIRAPFYYCFGAILRKHNIVITKNTHTLILLIIFSVAWICYAIITHLYIAHATDIDFIGKIQAKFLNAIRAGGMIPFISISLFLIFTRFNFVNKKINSLANCCFGIYLIHDSNQLRNIIWSQYIQPVKTHFILPLPNYILYSFITIISIFLVCAIIDYTCNKLIIKPLLSKFYSIIKKITIKVTDKNEINITTEN